MFVRIKKSGNHKYLQIVHNVRNWGKVKQMVIANLGRLDKYTEDLHLLDIAQSFKDLHKKIKETSDPKALVNTIK